MKIWLDDERKAPEGWVHVYTVPKLISMFNSNDIEELSLDHDLGEDEMTGYAEMKQLKIAHQGGKANPVGRKNMELCLISIKNNLLK